jgi:hypothetical protein
MIASCVSAKLDMLSHKQWDGEACEHIYSEFQKTQQLITYELVLVYHAQHNASPDFSNTEEIDWFAEGLATDATRQCDSIRMIDVKNQLLTLKYPIA